MVAGPVVLAAAAHIHFIAIDVRPPVDLGHYYVGAVDAVWTGDWSRADGLYAKSLAAVLRFSRTSLALELMSLWWVIVLSLSMGVCGRRLGGRSGAWVAGGAILLFPVFPTGARVHWIHHPEVALSVAGLALAVSLRRRIWGSILLGVVLAYVNSVRPSAVVWASGGLLVWAWRCRDRPHILLGAALPWIGSVVPMVYELREYLALRMQVRAGTAQAVGNPWVLLPIQTGWAYGIAAAALAVGGLWRGSKRVEPLHLIAGSWLLGGAVVIGAFGAGPDNVPTAFAGLALLASAGAPLVPPRWGGVLIVAAALGPLTQVVPALGVAGPVTGWFAVDHRLNWLVPRSDGLSMTDLRDSFGELCSGPCTVLLEQGLVHPSWEDDGRLALFLGGISGVRAWTVPTAPPSTYDAAVAWGCAGPSPDSSLRFPDAARRFQEAVSGLEVVLSMHRNGCEITWYGRQR